MKLKLITMAVLAICATSSYAQCSSAGSSWAAGDNPRILGPTGSGGGAGLLGGGVVADAVKTLGGGNTLGTFAGGAIKSLAGSGGGMFVNDDSTGVDAAVQRQAAGVDAAVARQASGMFVNDDVTGVDAAVARQANSGGFVDKVTDAAGGMFNKAAEATGFGALVSDREFQLSDAAKLASTATTAYGLVKGDNTATAVGLGGLAASNTFSGQIDNFGTNAANGNFSFAPAGAATGGSPNTGFNVSGNEVKQLSNAAGMVMMSSGNYQTGAQVMGMGNAAGSIMNIGSGNSSAQQTMGTVGGIAGMVTGNSGYSNLGSSVGRLIDGPPSSVYANSNNNRVIVGNGIAGPVYSNLYNNPTPAYTTSSLQTNQQLYANQNAAIVNTARASGSYVDPAVQAAFQSNQQAYSGYNTAPSYNTNPAVNRTVNNYNTALYQNPGNQALVNEARAAQAAINGTAPISSNNNFSFGSGEGASRNFSFYE